MEGGRQTDRQTDRQRERERRTKTEREAELGSETHRETIMIMVITIKKDYYILLHKIKYVGANRLE